MTFILKVLTVFCILQNVSVNCFSARVYGGKRVDWTENQSKNYPFIAALEIKGSHDCAAIIIRDNALLTTAHCLQEIAPEDFIIRAGTYDSKLAPNPSNHVQVRTVRSFVAHLGYNFWGNNEMDVGIIQLHQKFDLNEFVNTIEMASSEDVGSFNGETAQMLGWGEYQKDNKNYSSHLMAADLFVTTKKQCTFMKNLDDDESEGMLCTKPATGNEGACSGDSGGPLFVSRKGQPLLIGISSGGLVHKNTRNCAPETGSVFGEVAVYRDWIEKWLKRMEIKFEDWDKINV